MHDFKDGDLALIIRDSDDYNVMKQVALIEYVNPGGSYTATNGQLIINWSGVGVWHVLGDVINEEGVMGFCQKAPHNLMPLRGDLNQVKEKEEELV